VVLVLRNDRRTYGHFCDGASRTLGKICQRAQAGYRQRNLHGGMCFLPRARRKGAVAKSGGLRATVHLPGFQRLSWVHRRTRLAMARQIGKVIEYVRSLCTEKGWPRGNFNLPLPLVTEKAFPEDEVVLSGGLNLHGPPGGDATVLFEKRIGPSSMIEARVPYNVSQDSGTTRSGFGDIGLGYKRKVFDNLNAGSIFSVGGEVLAPTGNPRIGTGGGSPLLEAYVAYGQILPASSFLQFQTGYELSTQPDKVPRAYFVRTAIGKTFMTGGGLGRWWTPMTEFIADRDLVSGARTNWDVLPEIQIPLSKRLHIRANIGVRIPVNNTSGRPKQLLIYFLWDYADGTLKQGW
jgi:hypothetical protein